MTFYPITALLDGVAGKEHLARAVNLYLEHKPPIEELRYFLEFQIPYGLLYRTRSQATQGRKSICPSLQFSMMGQKFMSTNSRSQLGEAGNSLVATPRRDQAELTEYSSSTLGFSSKDPTSTQGHPCGNWCFQVEGPDEQDSRWFEPVKWKNFSHVTTAPIENPETFIGDLFAPALSLQHNLESGILDQETSCT